MNDVDWSVLSKLPLYIEDNGAIFHISVSLTKGLYIIAYDAPNMSMFRYAKVWGKTLDEAVEIMLECLYELGVIG